MKSGDAYRFSLSWPMATEEQILAGEFLSKLGNKKSRFIIQLVCEYLNLHPEVLDPGETIRFVVNSTSLGDRMVEMIKSLIQTELAGKTIQQVSDGSCNEEQEPVIDQGVGSMFDNLDAWNP